jgi:hypothetical protein
MNRCLIFATLLITISCGSDKGNNGNSASGPFAHYPLVESKSISIEDALNDLRTNHHDDFHRLYKGQSWKKVVQSLIPINVPEISFNQNCTYVEETSHTVTDFNTVTVKVYEHSKQFVVEESCKKIIPNIEEQKVVAVYNYQEIFDIDEDLGGVPEDASLSVFKGILNGSPHLSIVGSFKDEDNNNIQMSALVNMNQSALYNIVRADFKVVTEGKLATGYMITSILADTDLATLNLAGVGEMNKEWQ